MGTKIDKSVETKKLLEEARSGHPEALDKLFERYRAYIRQVIDLRLEGPIGQRLDASDVIQNTQLEAARRLPEYLQRQPVGFSTWLHQIARDQLIMARRRHVQAGKRAIARESRSSERSSLQLAEQLVASGSSPSGHLAKQELIQRMRQAMNNLPQDHREILLMRSVEQLSYEDIGYILGIEPAAARKRHGRALVRLSEELRRSGLTESQL